MTAGAHPLIQIDGRGAAGIREMFVQSNNRQIFLLPVPPAGPPASYAASGLGVA